MGDVDVQPAVDLSRDLGSAVLNDTFDFHHINDDEDKDSLEEEFPDPLNVFDDDEDHDDEDEVGLDEEDDWLLQEELAKLRAEWDDYVENMDDVDDVDEEYSPVDMKKRLRQLNEEWAAIKLVERNNTKVKFREQLVSLEIPPAEYQDENVLYQEEVEDERSEVEDEANGAGDKEEHEAHRDMSADNGKIGEGDREGDLSDICVKKLNLDEQAEETKSADRTEGLDRDIEVKGQLNGNQPKEDELITTEVPIEFRDNDSKTEKSTEVQENVKNKANVKDETNMSNDYGSPPTKKEEQILIERDGKFELVQVNDLSVEERNIMGLSSVPQNRNSNNGTESQQPSTKSEESSSPERNSVEGSEELNTAKGNVKETPKKERPSTATTFQSLQKLSIQKRRIMSAKSSSYEELRHYERPEGYSSYGLSPEQKERKKKQLLLKGQRLEERRQKEEDEKRRQQEEAESAFQAWVKRKQQEAIEKKKTERQKRKGQAVKSEKDPKEAEETYEAWLKAKKEQARKEKKLNRQKKKEEKGAYFYRSRKECDAAFKEWMKIKKSLLQEENLVKKSGAQQTTQKSRKARNLTKSLQVEQTYKSTDNHGYRL